MKPGGQLSNFLLINNLKLTGDILRSGQAGAGVHLMRPQAPVAGRDRREMRGSLVGRGM